MNWLCWHVGSCADPKFKLIAKKTGASLSQVIHVWAYHLELAAEGAIRGDFGEIDADEAELATEIPKPIWLAIVIAFEDRALIEAGRVKNFDKRNYGNSTIRVRAFRERQRRNGETLQLFHETGGQNTPPEAPCNDETLQANGHSTPLKSNGNVTVTLRNATGHTGHTGQNKNHKNDAGASVNLFNGPLEWLISATGKSEQQCRTLIGRFRKEAGDDGLVFNAMMAAQRAGAVEPVSYITAALKPKPKKKTEQMPL